MIFLRLFYEFAKVGLFAVGGGLGGLISGLPSSLEALLSRLLPDSLETEDLLLMLILYLMYRESGDRELLIIMGAMLFL